MALGAASTRALLRPDEAGDFADGLRNFDLRAAIEAFEDGGSNSVCLLPPPQRQRRERPSFTDAGGCGAGNAESLFDCLDELGSFKQERVFSDRNRVGLLS